MIVRVINKDGKKKMKRKKIFIIAGIFLAVVLFILALLQFTGTVNFLSIYPSTLSLSKVQLKSNFAPLNGDAFLITFTLGQTEAQGYEGTFSASEINSKLPDEEVEDGFNIEVKFDKQKCSYDIERAGFYHDVYKLDEYTWTCLAAPSELKAKEKSGFNLIEYYGFYSYKCFAIGTNEVHPVGNLESPVTEQSYDITISTEDGTDTKTLSTTGQGSVTFDDYAYATYQGGLLTAYSCQNKAIDEDNYVPIYKDGRWVLYSKSIYNDYKTTLNSITGNQPSQRETYIANVNYLANKILSGQNLDGYFENRYDKLNGKFIAELESPVFLPVTSLYIKAETLGIVTKVPEFEIVDLETSNFQFGTSGYVRVEVKNTGEEDGNAEVYMTCQGVFSSNDKEIVGLDVGETGFYNLRLTGTSTKEISDYCTVYLRYLDTTKSKRIKVTGLPQISCTPNEEFCSVNNAGQDIVKKCNAYGSGSNLIETCLSNEICENEECVEEGVSGNFWDKLKSFFSNSFKAIGNFFKNLFGGVITFFTIVKYILVAVGVLFAFTFSRDLLENKTELEKNVILGISIVLGVLVGWFLIKFIYAPIFWVILVGLLIFKFFGGRFKK